MPYTLENITPDDREKIIEDAKCDPSKMRDLVYAARDVRDFPKSWALDRERNFYMYFAPILIRRETMGSSVYFFFREVLYEIRIETAFGSEVSIVDSPPHSLLREFQEEVAAAFTVFGRSGCGNKDFFGHPDYFSPEFRKV